VADNGTHTPARLAQHRLVLAIATLLGGVATVGASGNQAAPGAAPSLSTALLTHAPDLISAAAVTSCTDDGGFDTLRHAVLTANVGDTIDLSALSCSKITLGSAIPVNFAPLTIIGPGAGNLTIDGNYVDRVFVNNSSGTLTLRDLTIAHGTFASTNAYGGCVYSKGSVTLERVVVNACTASAQVAARGGGVFTTQDLEADASVFSNNVAVAQVGGIGSLTAGGAAVAAGTLTLQGSTISGNSALSPNGRAYGGAVMGAQMYAKYSTFTNNEAGGGGSAVGGALRSGTPALIYRSTLDHNKADIGGAVSIIAASGNAGILQSTLSSNTAKIGLGCATSTNVDIVIENSTIAFNDGGVTSVGVWIANGSVTLNSTIIADNAGFDIDAFQGTQLGGSNNLIRLPSVNAKAPGGTIALDPNLGPLAYNGGRMRTHAIDATSPAFEAGSNESNLASDERGARYARSVGAAVDIGAFEFDSDHIFGEGFELH